MSGVSRVGLGEVHDQARMARFALHLLSVVPKWLTAKPRIVQKPEKSWFFRFWKAPSFMPRTSGDDSRNAPAAGSARSNAV